MFDSTADLTTASIELFCFALGKKGHVFRLFSLSNGRGCLNVVYFITNVIFSKSVGKGGDNFQNVSNLTETSPIFHDSVFHRDNTCVLKKNV